LPVFLRIFRFSFKRRNKKEPVKALSMRLFKDIGKEKKRRSRRGAKKNPLFEKEG